MGDLEGKQLDGPGLDGPGLDGPGLDGPGLDGPGLDGHWALVCGASSGIGRAAAIALAGRGASVVALARSEEKLLALVEAGGAKEYVVADLNEPVERVPSGRPFTILVNNSGGPKPGPLLDAEPEDLLQAFRRHVLASHALVRLLLPGMREAGYGRIVNVISTSVREPIPNLGVSNTIRAAMAGFSKTLSRELPPGVTINNVLPGFTATERLRSLGEATAARTKKSYEDVERGWIEQIPEGRLAAPSEIAALIGFLASPEAGYVRGQSIAVDGGRMRSI